MEKAIKFEWRPLLGVRIFFWTRPRLGTVKAKQLPPKLPEQRQMGELEMARSRLTQRL